MEQGMIRPNTGGEKKRADIVATRAVMVPSSRNKANLMGVEFRLPLPTLPAAG